MKVKDVALALTARLPAQSALLTRNLAVTGVTRNGTLAVFQCNADHGLQPGSTACIVGAKTPISITSLTRASTIGTMVLASAHDLTPATHKTVDVEGANEPEFNGTFTIIRIVDELTIEFVMADAGATTATGSPVLTNGESYLRGYDGAFPVRTVPSSSAFEIDVEDATLPVPVGDIEARILPRIAAAATVDRALDSFTERSTPWLYAVLGPVTASRARNIGSDAVDNPQRSQWYRQQLIQPFDLYFVRGTPDEIAGAQARDEAESLFPAICRSVLFERFDSGLSRTAQGTVHFLSHGVFRYDGAVYVHLYSFAQVAELNFEDTVGPSPDVALRQIDLSVFPDLPEPGATGIESLDASIDLEEPLP